MANPIERVNQAFDALSARIAMIDRKGDILSVNAAWRSLAAEHQADCGIGTNYLAACDTAHGDEFDDGRMVGHGIRAVLRERLQEFSYDYPLQFDNRRYWFRLTARPVHEGAMIMHVDITSLVTARKLSADAVGNDPLTDFITRNRFDMELEARVSIAMDCRECLGLLIVRIEGLSSINARFGYHAGDVYLREIAARLRTHTKPGDSLARLGGDELSVILNPLSNSAAAVQQAEHIHRVMSKPLMLIDEIVHPTINIGVACAPEHASDAGALIDFADQAARVAQRRGTGFHCPELDRGLIGGNAEALAEPGKRYP